MPYIFLSHSTKDNDFTRFLNDALKDEGFDVWVDFEDIEPGQRWLHAIQNGIEESAAVVVVMSKAAQASEWCEREALLAMDLKKPIHTALIETMPLPLHLINRQFTDFRKDRDEAAKRLAAALFELDLDTAGPRKVPKSLSPMPDEENFFEYLAQLPGGENNRLIAKDLFQWGETNGDHVEFGGKITPGFHVRAHLGNTDIAVFSVWGYSRQPAVQVQFQYLADYEPYNNTELRRSTLNSLNRLLGDEPLMEDKADRRPTLQFSKALNTADKLEAFKQVMQEIIDNLRSV